MGPSQSHFTTQVHFVIDQNADQIKNHALKPSSSQPPQPAAPLRSYIGPAAMPTANNYIPLSVLIFSFKLHEHLEAGCT